MSEFFKKRQKTRRLIPDYLFKSNYFQIEGIKIHYVDEGCFDDPVLLFLHGVPTWSFTFRKIIPECVSAGNRVIAPDLPGFGKSDNPGSENQLTMEIGTVIFHIIPAAMQRFFVKNWPFWHKNN